MAIEFDSGAISPPGRLWAHCPLHPQAGYNPSRGLSAESVIAATIARGARLITGVRARWIGCEPADTRRIYFANHTSHLDFILLWSVLPARFRRKTRPVAAHDYWKSGTLRRYLAKHVFRSVLVERGCSDRSINPIVPMLAALDRDESLVVFPEGTRGTGEALLPFKSGIFNVVCEQRNLELVPVWIDNAFRAMPKGSLLPMPLLCTVTFGPPTRIAGNEERTHFLDRLRQSLMDLKNA